MARYLCRAERLRRVIDQEQHTVDDRHTPREASSLQNGGDWRLCEVGLKREVPRSFPDSIYVLTVNLILFS